MAGVRIKKNLFPKIIAALPDAIDDEVDEAAADLASVLKSILWVNTGKLRRVTTDHPPGRNHAEVHVGYYLGHGFYSGFQEFGTVKQAPRPIVTPTAHEFEPVYAANRTKAVKNACKV